MMKAHHEVFEISSTHIYAQAHTIRYKCSLQGQLSSLSLLSMPFEGCTSLAKCKHHVTHWCQTFSSPNWPRFPSSAQLLTATLSEAVTNSPPSNWFPSEQLPTVSITYAEQRKVQLLWSRDTKAVTTVYARKVVTSISDLWVAWSLLCSSSDSISFCLVLHSCSYAHTNHPPTHMLISQSHNKETNNYGNRGEEAHGTFSLDPCKSSFVWLHKPECQDIKRHLYWRLNTTPLVRCIAKAILARCGQYLDIH